MADLKCLQRLKQGVIVWNAWRKTHLDVHVDLSYANLNHMDLSSINFTGVDLSYADLSYAHLNQANLQSATLHHANLSYCRSWEADLTGADLYKANLSHAYFIGSHFSRASLFAADLSATNLQNTDLSATDFSAANLDRTHLEHAHFHQANISNARLDSCSVYGISSQGISGQPAMQANLIVSPSFDAKITVDRLDIACFISFIMENTTMLDIIHRVISRIVLIIGCFSNERQIILSGIKDILYTRDYLPVVIHIERPGDDLNLIQTIHILSLLSRFILIDLSATMYLFETVEKFMSFSTVPIQILLDISVEMPTYNKSFEAYTQTLPLYKYIDQTILLHSFVEEIIIPIEQRIQVKEDT